MSETRLAGAYPWHEGALASLAARADAGRLPHGLLVTGPAGTGKSRFAAALTAALLCRERRDGIGTPCRTCRDCRVLASGTHPDTTRVEPGAADRPVIKVDQVRGLIEALMLSSQFGGRRIAVIDPAERLNVNAANSLLKTLEEPPADAVLLLVTSRPARLPATVRSRCQPVALPAPDPATAREWLAADGQAGAADLLGLAGGAPLRALALAEEGAGDRAARLSDALAALSAGRRDAPAVAAEWVEVGARRTAELVHQLLADAVRVKAGGREAARIPEAAPVHALVTGLDWRVLYSYVDELATLRRALEQPLNETLALERLFGGWRRTVTAPSALPEAR